jgi:beta-phosphoglucomutase-like phosphatase (HAD superfamily)
VNKLVIFDFDGVIVLRTEEITMGVIARMVGDSVERVGKLVMGMGGKALVERLGSVYGVNISEEKIMKERMKIMRGQGVLKKDDFLPTFLEKLKKQGIEYIVATSSSRPPVEIALISLGLREQFGVIYSIDDYPTFRSKQELYSLLREKYKGKEIFVIEDSPNGIKCAYNSKIGAVISYTGGKVAKQFYGDVFDDVKKMTVGFVSSFRDMDNFIGF